MYICNYLQTHGPALPQKNNRKLKRATVFVLLFFVVEIVGGIWSGSLAIISDAAHLLTDVSVSLFLFFPLGRALYGS